MPTAAFPSFDILDLPPSWDSTYTVEFRHYNHMLGNNYPFIKDGGTANPIETATIERLAENAVIDGAIATLKNAAGANALNWRVDASSDYKAWYCREFSEVPVGTNHKQIRATLERHPNPIYNTLPAISSTGNPWPLFPAPIQWDSEISTAYSVDDTSYGLANVKNRRSPSIFQDQLGVKTWRVTVTDTHLASRFNTVNNFLLSRWGMYPFQVSPDGTSLGRRDEHWVCQRWTWRKSGPNFYSLDLDLMQVYPEQPNKPVGDVQPPTVITFFPEQYSSDFLGSQNLLLVFDENIIRGTTGNITIKRLDNNATVETLAVTNTTRVVISGAAVTINPVAVLDPGTDYYVNIATTCFRDANGNFYQGIANASGWQFTTAIPDTSPPVITSYSPSIGSSGASINGKLLLTFNEAIARGTAGTVQIRRSGAGTLIESIAFSDTTKLIFSGNTLEIDLATALSEGLQYYVTVSASLIKDLAGNAFSGIAANAWNFTTSSTGPTAALSSTSPSVITAYSIDNLDLTVTYNSPVGVNSATLGTGDITVTVSGNTYTPTYLSQGGTINSRTATYRLAPPGGIWGPADNGSCVVSVVASQVADTNGAFVAAGAIGSFDVAVPALATTGSTATAIAASRTNANQRRFFAISASAKTVTIGNTFLAGDFVEFANKGAGVLTLEAGAGVTFTSGLSTAAAGEVLRLFFTANNVFISDTVVSTFTIDSTAPTSSMETVAAVTPGAIAHTIRVTYTDTTSGIDLSSISAADLTVTTPSSATLAATTAVIESSTATTATVLYTIPSSPAGGWDATSNGTYTVNRIVNQVWDNQWSRITAATHGAFTVAIANIPTARVSALSPSSITAYSVTPLDITVIYTSVVGLSLGTIGTGDITLTFGSTTYTPTLQSQSGTANSRTVVYRLNPPGGIWDVADNGVWAIAMVGSQVSDTASAFVAAGSLGTFTAAIPLLPVTGASGLSVDYFRSNSVQNKRWFFGNTSNKVAIMNAGFLTGDYFEFVNKTSSTLTVQAASGVTFTSGPSTAAIGQILRLFFTSNDTFISDTVPFSISLDSTPPTATLVPVPAVTNGATTHNLQVSFNDPQGIEPTAITTGDITVTTPVSTTLTPTAVAIASDDGTTLVATFTIPSNPVGGWGASSVGTYTVNLIANQVWDEHWNRMAAATLGTFSVANTGIPTASLTNLSTTAIATGSSTPVTIAVLYTSSVGIDSATLGDGDLTVTTGTTVYTPIYQSASGTANARTVVYSMVPPGGLWEIFDNGTYAIAVANGKVLDTAGTAVPVTALGSFTVSLPTLEVRGASGTTVNFFRSNSVQNKRWFGANTAAKSFVLESGFLAGDYFEFVNKTSGTLTVTPASGVTFSAGLATASIGQVLRIFFTANNVFISDTVARTITLDSTPPVATLQTVAAVTNGATTHTIRVTYSDSQGVEAVAIAATNITVTTPASTTLTASAFAIESSSDTSITVAYTIPSYPAGGWSATSNGTYTVNLAANSIWDKQFNRVAGGAIGTFVVGTTNPTGLIPWAQAKFSYPDSAWINIKNYGAVGNGIADDTAAFYAADAASRQGSGGPIGLPPGTYRITDQIPFTASSGNNRMIYGYDAATTIIKLDNSRAGFTNAGVPKSVIVIGGGGADDYRNYIQNLTIDVGTGNPGAIAIFFNSSNGGRIANVTVKAGTNSGKIGIRNFTAGGQQTPGQFTINDCLIDGFENAMNFPSDMIHQVIIRNVRIQNQRIAGIAGTRVAPLVIDNLVSAQAIANVPAIKGDVSGITLTLINSTFSNSAGSTGSAVIVSDYEANSSQYARNCSATGYASLLTHNGTVQLGGSLNLSGEYKPKILTTSRSQGSLSFPSVSWQTRSGIYDAATWAPKTPNPNVDTTGAFITVVNSGKAVVFQDGRDMDRIDFSATSPASTTIGNTTITTWDGLHKGFKTAGIETAARRFLRITGGNASSSPLLIRNFDQTAGTLNTLVIEHDTARPLYIQNSTYALARYVAFPGAGDLYMDQVSMLSLTFDGNRGFLCGCNPERFETHKDFVFDPFLTLRNGANVYVLGIKTEYDRIVAMVSGNSTLQIDGATFHITTGSFANQCIINNTDSKVIMRGVHIYGGNSPNTRFNPPIRETVNGVTINASYTESVVTTTTGFSELKSIPI